MMKCSHVFQVLFGYFIFYCIFLTNALFRCLVTFITCMTGQQYNREHLLHLAAIIYSRNVSKFLMNNAINSGKFSWKNQDSLSKYCRIRPDRVIKIPK